MLEIEDRIFILQVKMCYRLFSIEQENDKINFEILEDYVDNIVQDSFRRGNFRERVVGLYG